MGDLVAADEIPVELSCRSPTNLVIRRLEELALPKHYTQLDKWTPVEQRENELLRWRNALAAHDAGRRMEPAIPMGEPRESSKTERDVHELTHLPRQQWRDHCVRGRSS